MKIGVAFAKPNAQVWLHVEVEAGTTAQQAIERSGILEKFPEIDLGSQKIGVFGKTCPPDHVLEDGDRVEIYRPITADPKAVKRKDVKAKPETAVKPVKAAEK